MILDRILERKREEVAALRAPRRSLAAALSSPEVAVIAEIKRASPSRGVIRAHVDPAFQLRRYVSGGAAAVSVVTDGPFFGGDGEMLRELAPISSVPLLRKDFLIDPIQLFESLFLGADAVLLIAAALEGKALARMISQARDLGLEALVEVHDEADLERVLGTEARLVGINNRDLTSFEVDLRTTERLVAQLERLEPGSRRLVVAESGVKDASDTRFLRDCGADAVLVGEALMCAEDPGALVAAMRGATATPGGHAPFSGARRTA